jgi:hypothetical protein
VVFQALYELLKEARFCGPFCASKYGLLMALVDCGRVIVVSGGCFGRLEIRFSRFDSCFGLLKTFFSRLRAYIGRFTLLLLSLQPSCISCI